MCCGDNCPCLAIGASDFLVSVGYASTPTQYTIQTITIAVNPSSNVNIITAFPTMVTVDSGTWLHGFIHIGGGVYQKQLTDNTDVPQVGLSSLFAPMSVQADLLFTLLGGISCSSSLLLVPTEALKESILPGTANFPCRIYTNWVIGNTYQSNYFIGASPNQVGVVYEQSSLHEGNGSGEYTFDSATGTFTLNFTPSVNDRLFFERIN